MDITTVAVPAQPPQPDTALVFNTDEGAALISVSLRPAILD